MIGVGCSLFVCIDVFYWGYFFVDLGNGLYMVLGEMEIVVE